MSTKVPYSPLSLELNEEGCPANPLDLFSLWYGNAVDSGLFTNPGAMTVSTVSDKLIPSGRMVLLKYYGEEGFSFFTSLNSPKARDLTNNPNTALTFYWQNFERQVRLQGVAIRLTRYKVIKYFATRPVPSQISAMASPQSQVIQNRNVLQSMYNKVKSELGNSTIPKPRHWGGFRVVPSEIEFWQGREHRLHDRMLYTKQSYGWQKQRLAP